jgi:GTP pyrophosphokinase
MNNEEKERLSGLVLAPYIQKAYALVGINRKVGGNQFRHCMATMVILIDYHYIEPVLLKAAIIHDLIEDFVESTIEDIRNIHDGDEYAVVNLVLEVSKLESETKAEFLNRILLSGSKYAKILKCADRISNLTDLHLDAKGYDKMISYLEETEKYVYPMAREVNHDMLLELQDLVNRRRIYLKTVPKSTFKLLSKLFHKHK